MAPPQKGKKLQGRHARRVESGAQSLSIQKLKSSIRQTKRLLAKDSINVDVKVESERRLKSLLADLETAERVKKEKSMAGRYHKVKFFERQKILRRINRTKRQLGALEQASQEQQGLKATLRSYRVQLNYIVNYPKDQKYISLFPSESGTTGEGPGTGVTEVRRAELLKSITKAMKRGEMDGEPELAFVSGRIDEDLSDEEAPNEESSGSEAAAGNERKLPEVARKRKGRVEVEQTTQDDDFFEAPSD